jgi:hypothetical protein
MIKSPSQWLKEDGLTPNSGESPCRKKKKSERRNGKMDGKTGQTNMMIPLLLISMALVAAAPIGKTGESVIHGYDVTQPPQIKDFYVNSTWAGQASQFAFNCTDSAGLVNGTLTTNVTSTYENDTVSLAGTVAWANFTKTLPSCNCEVGFQFWVWNQNTSIYATTGLRIMKVYTYNSTVDFFKCLGDAITSVEKANNWNSVEPYAQVVLEQTPVSTLSSMIDNYSTAQDWADALKWSAFCNKLNITRQQALNYALGNYTMLGNLPQTGYDTSNTAMFSPEHKWGLYGYWYANSSWARAYNPSITAKWNITAAFQQFNSSVYYSVNHSPSGLPLWMYADGTGRTYSNRYYDEDACTIDCYIIFAQLLNVSGAMDEALHWWSYLNTVHWNGGEQHYGYTGTNGYECEAAFFLKIISTLKYYCPALGNWINVLTDIGNRYVSHEWRSPQWLDSSNNQPAYVVVHMYPGNPQRRLQNTLGAWQALLGVYLQLNSTCENSIRDMLYGSINTEPAWALLFHPEAKLYYNWTGLFRWGSSSGPDANATAWAEILMFMMGIVPGTTTTAFPLEELMYEYTQDTYPAELRLNTTLRQIAVPVNSAGNLTFQYGVSPITYNFNQSGVWQITFTDSWNMIKNVTLASALPSNVIHFAQIYLAPTLTINATAGGTTDPTPGTYTYSSGTVINVTASPNTDYLFDHWELDGSNVGAPDPISITMNTNHTLEAVFVLRSYTLTITVTDGGTTDPTPGTRIYSSGTVMNVTAWPDTTYYFDHWELDGVNVGGANPINILMNKDYALCAVFKLGPSPTFYTLNITVTIGGTTSPTPGTYAYSSGTVINVTASPNTGCLFDRWELDGNDAGASNPMNATMDADHTLHAVFLPYHDVAVTNVTPYKTVAGQLFSLNVSLTVADQGGYDEIFNITVYANTTIITTLTNITLASGNSTIITLVWNTTGFAKGNYTISAYAWPVPEETNTTNNEFTDVWVIVSDTGDITGPNGWPDGKVDMRDIAYVAKAFGTKLGDARWNPNADVTGTTAGVPDGKVDMKDISAVARYFGQHDP